MKRNSNISKSLIEVWYLKEEAYKEVKYMAIELAIRKRIENSISTAKEMGFEFSKASQKVFNC